MSIHQKSSAQTQEAVIFFAGGEIRREMLYPEFEALLDCVVPIRDFAGTVSRIEDLTPTVKGIWIDLPAGAALRFQAGQYVNLRLPDGIGHRAFSIASVPSEGNTSELNVRRDSGGLGPAIL